MDRGGGTWDGACSKVIKEKRRISDGFVRDQHSGIWAGGRQGRKGANS